MPARARDGTRRDRQELQKEAIPAKSLLTICIFLLVSSFSSFDALIFLFLVVSNPIATAIWSYQLSRATDWARGSIANTDAPLAYELPAALAFRGHIVGITTWEWF